MPMGSLLMRRLPNDEPLIQAEVHRLLRHQEQEESGPSGPAEKGGKSSRAKRYPGIIAQTEPIADSVAAALKALGLVLGRDVAVAASGIYRPAVGGKPVHYPHVRMDVPPEQVGKRLAEKLLCQVRDPNWKTDHEILPVEFERPMVEVPED